MRLTTNIARISVVSAALILSLGACASSRFGPTTASGEPPAQLEPLTTSSVQTSQLPPLGGADGTVTTAGNGLDPLGQSNDPLLGDPALTGDVANADGSFVDLDGLGDGTAPTGRNLSGGLSITKLLGVWNISSGTDQCRLNLTQTSKTGTERYRASTPGCTITGLSTVASWQLAGTQVQLFDEAGTLIGALLLNGEGFIGTLAGGQGVTMTG